MVKTMPLPWPNNADGNPIGSAEYIIALMDQVEEEKKKNAVLAEKCAIMAWNHFMEVCKKKGIPPAGNEEWCSSQHIRDNWRK